MAAPTPTARSTPVGRRLEDGYQSLFTFASNPTLALWEISLTPPGLDGGDAVDTTTMHNEVVRTMGPRALRTMTEAQMTVAYDPAVLDDLLDLINTPDTITQTHANGDQWAFYGYLRTFEPDEVEEGTMPTATCTIQPTNTDPSDGAEASPNFVSAAGTD